MQMNRIQAVCWIAHGLGLKEEFESGWHPYLFYSKNGQILFEYFKYQCLSEGWDALGRFCGERKIRRPLLKSFSLFSQWFMRRRWETEWWNCVVSRLISTLVCFVTALRGGAKVDVVCCHHLAGRASLSLLLCKKRTSSWAVIARRHHRKTWLTDNLCKL